MLTINKITSSNVVDYAAEELKKYLRMMMPEDGDVKIAYDPEAKDGFRLGLMQDFGLDVSDVEETELDDILYIDCDTEGGIIAGDNPRSVLLSVYEYLRQNGCIWLFPGVDGEYIPMKKNEPVKYRFVPSCRYRGQCNEGAEFQQSMMASIEFMPKIGMNTFMIEFRNPHTYYSWYYDHPRNASRPPEPISFDTALQWKRMCETEMAKRGLMFHDIGHGFTIDPFGIDSTFAWNKVDDSMIPDDQRKYLALYKGKRKFYRDQPLNTQFCMSNAEARTMIAKYVAEYAEKHSNIDYLHIWLADDSNNHCECDECKKLIPSDWYMLLMNEIDEELTKKNLSTRIVFIVYIDTVWAPIVHKINKPERFSAMLAAIQRSYTQTLPELPADFKTVPFKLNENVFPKNLSEFFAYWEEWKKDWHGAAFCYEYHFWRHQACEISGTVLAKRIIEDVKAYKANGINGVIEDGSQRSYFPNGLAFYTYARILFNNDLTYEQIAEEYYSHAYGKDWKQFLSYFERLGEALDQGYLEGEKPSNPAISAYYRPEYLENLDLAEKILAEGEELVKSHYNSDERVQTVSVRLMERHIEYCRGFIEIFRHKAIGEDSEAEKIFNDFCNSFGAHEPEIELCYDHLIFTSTLRRIIDLHPSQKPNETTQL